MNDTEIIEMLIAEYKALPHKEKGKVPEFIKDSIANYKNGRTKGMNLKNIVILADYVGYEFAVYKKQD